MLCQPAKKTYPVAASSEAMMRGLLQRCGTGPESGPESWPDGRSSEVFADRDGMKARRSSAAAVMQRVGDIQSEPWSAYQKAAIQPVKVVGCGQWLASKRYW